LPSSLAAKQSTIIIIIILNRKSHSISIVHYSIANAARSICGPGVVQVTVVAIPTATEYYHHD
jgi:hypothetical protein